MKMRISGFKWHWRLLLGARLITKGQHSLRRILSLNRQRAITKSMMTQFAVAVVTDNQPCMFAPNPNWVRGVLSPLGRAGGTTPCILSRPQLCSDLFQIFRAGSLGWSFRRVRPTLSHLINYVHNDPRNDFGQPCDHRPCAIGHTCVRISTTFGIQVPLGIRPTLTHVIWTCIMILCQFAAIESPFKLPLQQFS